MSTLSNYFLQLTLKLSAMLPQPCYDTNMKRSKHLRDTYTQMSKKRYLQGVKARLINDVGTYFAMVDAEGSKGNMVGFWGSARLIFPVIEAVAKTLYRENGKEDRRVPRLLMKLNIPYPDLVWQMYRNSLAHSDHLVHISRGSKTINWSVTASAGGISTGHIFVGGTVHIDTRRLYEDFLQYLNNEIAQAKTSLYVKTGLKVSIRYTGGLRDEIKNFP